MIFACTNERHLMQEQLGMLKPTVVEEPIMSGSLTPPVLLAGPTISLAENIEEETREEEKGKNDKETKSAKIQRLKSSFQICKPKGTFMWPNMSLSPHVMAYLDEQHTMVPTPTSASSSTTSAPKFVSKSIPYPSSPVKPLAERRPVSTATLTHVTGPISPHISHPLETPKSTLTTTITKNAFSMNLNEFPLAQR